MDPSGSSQTGRADGMYALRQRLPGQRTPPDPSLEQPNAADLTYGWHHSSSSGDDSGEERHEHEPGNADNASDASSDDLLFDDAMEDALLRRDLDAANAQRTRPAANAWNISATRMTEDQSTSSSRWPWKQLWGDDRAEGDGGGEDKRERGGQGAQGQDGDQSQSFNGVDDSFICRICFDGPGSIGDGGESLGKLIAPCRCRGTMKFVHQRCLTRWRATSRRESSVMQCDQCGAPYRFRKSRFVGLATNKWLLVLLSCYLFLSIVWVVGFVAETTVSYLEDPIAKPNPVKPSRTGWWPFGRETNEQELSMGSRIYRLINLDRNDDQYYSNDNDDFYRYEYRYGYSEPAAYYTLIKAAVKYVGSGQAFQQLFSGAEEEEQGETAGMILDSQKEDDKGWWSALSERWTSEKGRQGAKKVTKDSADRSSSEDGEQRETGLPTPEMLDSTSEGMTKREQSGVSNKRKRYDAITAQELRGSEVPVRPVTRKRAGKKAQRATRGQKRSGWVERLTVQFSLGASLVGISSFLSLLLGISTWGPFHLNLGLGRGFARVARRRSRGGGGGGGNEGEALVAVFLLFLVIVGIIRALFAVYGLTTYMSKRLLTRVEDIIIDWSNEEDDAEPQQQQQQQQMDNVRPDAPAHRRWRRVFQWPPTMFVRRRAHID